MYEKLQKIEEKLKSPLYELKRIGFPLYLAACAFTVDRVTTMVGYDSLPGFVEINPVANMLMEQMGHNEALVATGVGAMAAIYALGKIGETKKFDSQGRCPSKMVRNLNSGMGKLYDKVNNRNLFYLYGLIEVGVSTNNIANLLYPI